MTRRLVPAIEILGALFVQGTGTGDGTPTVPPEARYDIAMTLLNDGDAAASVPYFRSCEAGVVLEPAGIIPWCIPNPIIDEVGIADPQVARDRASRGDGWFASLGERRPHLFLTRMGTFTHNEGLGGAGRPFASGEDLASWLRHYKIVGGASADQMIVDPKRGMFAIARRLPEARNEGSVLADFAEAGITLMP